MIKFQLETVLLALGVTLFLQHRQAERERYRAKLLSYWEYDPPNRSLNLLSIAGQQKLAEDLKKNGMSDIPRSLALHMIDVAVERNVPLFSFVRPSDTDTDTDTDAGASV